MRIKVCGLNPARDTQLCIDLKVNYLGFIFYKKSPRNVSLSDVTGKVPSIVSVKLAAEPEPCWPFVTTIKGAAVATVTSSL